MTLPGLPELPSLSQRPEIKRKGYTQNVFPIQDWGFGTDLGYDFWTSPGGGGSFGGGSFDIFGPGPGGGGGGFCLFNCGPVYGSNPIGGAGGGGGGGVITIGGSGGSGTAGAGKATSTGAFGIPFLPDINWGRIAAFLLGLLLIGIGLYMIKPVQQAVNVTVKTARKAATTAAETMAE